MSIAEKIKQRRKSLHLSQYHLAELVGVSAYNVRKWESGDTDNMTIATLTRLAAALNVSPGQILDDSSILPEFQAIQFVEHISLSYSIKKVAVYNPAIITANTVKHLIFAGTVDRDYRVVVVSERNWVHAMRGGKPFPEDKA